MKPLRDWEPWITRLGSSFHHDQYCSNLHNNFAMDKNAFENSTANSSNYPNEPLATQALGPLLESELYLLC
eukprot:4222376-Amphidinium_carterae.2